MHAYLLTLMNMQKHAPTLPFYTANTSIGPPSTLSHSCFALRTKNWALAAQFAWGCTTTPPPHKCMDAWTMHVILHHPPLDWILLHPRVQHGYRNTCGVSKMGHAGSGTVWESDNCSYTVPITIVSWCHMITLRQSLKLHQTSSCPFSSSSSSLPQASGKQLVDIL